MLGDGYYLLFNVRAVIILFKEMTKTRVGLGVQPSGGYSPTNFFECT
jgi:hypothetical protein